VFRSLTARPDRAATIRGVDLVRVVDVIRALGIAVVLVTVSIARPHPGQAGARGTAVAVALAVSAVAWIVWMLARRHHRLTVAALSVMAVAGGALAGLSPNSPAVIVGCIVAVTAGAALAADVSLAITAGTVAAFLAAGLAVGAQSGYVIGYSFAFAGLWAVGTTRRSYRVRAEQAEQMLAESHRAREAETHAAALAERARIAREIHDVLAHSLAAVSVNLQAAEGLLGAETLPAGNPELAKAIDCIGRASTLTREGLVAARRAIQALRDDAAPLPDQLSSLAGEYRAAGDLAVDFSVSGEPRPLTAEASLTAYRTAQEGLTNARKHAPGQPVTLCLGFGPAQITVRVCNPLPPHGTRGALAADGAGYGLTGLRERAALAGGELQAGPADGRWRVLLRIPA
jgi:signal transduction histidine kinase